MTARRKLSRNHKKKIAKALKGHRPWSKGRKVTKAQRRRIGIGLRAAYASGNRIVSPEQIERWKHVNDGREPWNKGKKGIYSDKVIKQMSASQKHRFDSLDLSEYVKMTDNMRKALAIKWQQPESRAAGVEQLNKARAIRWQRYRERQRPKVL